MSADHHRRRYQKAAEALQHGVHKAAALLNNPEMMPRNLRISISKNQIEADAILMLLMRKGVITEEEYLEAIADATEAEVHRYENFLTEKLGVKITLLE